MPAWRRRAGASRKGGRPPAIDAKKVEQVLAALEARRQQGAPCAGHSRYRARR